MGDTRAEQTPRTILYAHSSSGRYGADRQLLALATGADPARYRAIVVLPAEGELAADLRAAGIEVHLRRLGVLRRALLSPAGLARVGARVIADAVALGRLARAQGVALVHSNTSVTLGGAAAALRTGLPHVYSVREIYTDFERLWPAYRRVLLGTADVLCCSSEATCGQFGGDPRARVVHEGVTAAATRAERGAARAALALPPDAFVCVVLGRISSWKGQEVLVRALAAPPLRDSGALALIAGAAWPGEERHEHTLRVLTAGLGLGDRVRFAGFRPDTGNLYGAADVVVVPSTQPDPLPNSALE
ncbi:MAG TPA: glycosyltransferase, partial [Solirubrobacteraceae bacterium]